MNPQDDDMKTQKEQLAQKHSLEWEHLQQQHIHQLDSGPGQVKFHLDQFSVIFPVQMKHLIERHELEKMNLKDQQQLEREQQARLLGSELKTQKREFTRKQQLALADFQQQVKQLPKTIKVMRIYIILFLPGQERSQSCGAKAERRVPVQGPE